MTIYGIYDHFEDLERERERNFIKMIELIINKNIYIIQTKNVK